MLYALVHGRYTQTRAHSVILPWRIDCYRDRDIDGAKMALRMSYVRGEWLRPSSNQPTLHPLLDICYYRLHRLIRSTSWLIPINIGQHISYMWFDIDYIVCRSSVACARVSLYIVFVHSSILCIP